MADNDKGLNLVSRSVWQKLSAALSGFTRIWLMTLSSLSLRRRKATLVTRDGHGQSPGHHPSPRSKQEEQIRDRSAFPARDSPDLSGSVEAGPRCSWLRE